MRQIGSPPGIDRLMNEHAVCTLTARGYRIIDADASTGAKDFLERIFGLIRGTSITAAVFSGETRGTALANIMLELGFAAMCGKTLMILKSTEASAPSDLTRTDWINFDPTDVDEFERKINQALDEAEKLAHYEELLLNVALEADSMDCAVAIERVLKCFLLTGDGRFLEKAEVIKHRLSNRHKVDGVNDLQRLYEEISMIIKLGRASLNHSS